MEQYISKSALIAEINRLKKKNDTYNKPSHIADVCYKELLSFIDTLEVKDPYEQRIQYASIEDGIKDHAETYSFNIESELFNQLTKEQQALWRKEIEQACISGGEVGVGFARDICYKENVEVKEVDYERELSKYVSKGIHRFFQNEGDDYYNMDSVVWQDYVIETAKHFFELGLKAAQKGEEI